MIQNHIKLAFRSIIKYKGYSFINIFGLTIGITCCLIIFSWVRHETRYDLFHTNVDRIYRVGVDGFLGRSFRLPISSTPTGPAINEKYPEIENYTRLTRPQIVAIKLEDDEIYNIKMSSADSSFFNIFSYSLLTGNSDKVLKNPNTIVISENLSYRLFSGNDPIGKLIAINRNDEFEITGVFKDIQENSHLDFDVLVSMETLIKNHKISSDKWLPFNVFTYILVSPNTDSEILSNKLISVIKGTQLESILKNTGGHLSFFLQPLKDIHLQSQLEAEYTTNGNISTVYIFSIIAIVILIIGCINYINLSTALWSVRMKEIGLRKAFGASRKDLIHLLLLESIIHCLLALVLSLIIVNLVGSNINPITNFRLGFNLFESPIVIPLLILFAIVIGTLGGFYPAIFISSHSPYNILKNQIISGKKNPILRNVLVVVQFIFSITLIIGTIVMYSQMSYMQTKDLGFDKELVLYISNLSEEVINRRTLVKDRLNSVPGIKTISFSSSIPGVGYHKGLFNPEGLSEDESQSMDMLSVDSDYIQALELSIIEGRNFDPNVSSDSTEAVIINETAVSKFGWKDPIGKYFLFNTEQPGEKAKMYVIGVIKDFHITSMREIIEPIFIEYKPRIFNTISIKLKSNQLSKTIDQLTKTWKDILPFQPFNYKFLNDTYNGLYQSEVRLSKLILLFSVITVLLGCLGLFGISMFLIEKRTKEIGIRKVFGASIQKIFFLISMKYTQLIIVAFIIASLISWYVMNKWLENFAYKISLELWYFGIAGLLALCIAWFTISYQTIKAARKNPVDALRHE